MNRILTADARAAHCRARCCLERAGATALTRHTVGACVSCLARTVVQRIASCTHTHTNTRKHT